MTPVSHPEPDLCLLSTPPEQIPDLVAHPAPIWLELHTHTTGTSSIVAHVSNIEFVKWIDRSAEQALSSAGWSYQDLLDKQAMFFVARHEIDYRGEALAEETLHVATWVRDIRRVKSWRDTVIWRIQDDEPMIVCTASTLWVHVDLETRKPCRIPPEMTKALRPLQHDEAPWRVRS
ncbi:MAG: acyl-CoA thioesterase [Phycisphaerales bacterium]|nr:acyl-CoA thioesterase [Phycisphaerales bacterium]